jgi:hypothetical protein
LAVQWAEVSLLASVENAAQLFSAKVEDALQITASGEWNGWSLASRPVAL